ncbi:MarR family transcriptional regulator [Rhodococcus sp. RS1C4]|nr:MarR family transcriptional regulator [Rhodococcus sp. RS1C4]OZC57880.1 MarR family transcriptional regulator [Rhodococcus sp. 06-621-2]OZD10089.1 MarR family transcriptional regulator [Rhodococcus sp. 06-156-4C]OZD13970.1 MarR family transcriptional regulator [Rhodococcus sp. 06-156-4a]OZD14678.1 MarR family transcriptional regulator [Rhodococcus sp. 06-156-3C]OZD29759.1 MarR family transcriptional regulator [Rhodococcus sp. 06-156-3]OZD34408.1 MarR family transcriptional regulator [Rhodo
MYYVGVTDTTDPAVLASVLHDLSWIIQRTDRVEELGIERLPAPEVTVLKQIDRNTGIGVSALADMLAMQPSNVSAAVRTLVERGLVVKTPSPTDRRVTQLEVTDRMRRNRTRIEAAWSARITEALSRLPDEAAAQLVSAAPALMLLTNELRDRT